MKVDASRVPSTVEIPRLVLPDSVHGTADAAIFFDDFDRTGPSLGSDWTTPVIGPSSQRDPMEIATQGTAQPTNTANWHDAAYTGQPTPDDQFAEATVAVLNGGAFFNTAFGLYVRATVNTRQAYFASLWYDTANGKRYWEFGKLQAGAAVFFDFAYFDGPVWSVGTHIRLEAIDTTINFYIDGVLAATQVDSEYTSGNPCMLTSISLNDQADVQFESFRSGPTSRASQIVSVRDEAIRNAIEVIASRRQVTIGVGTVGFDVDVVFPRSNFTDMLLTIKSSEELGILDTAFVEDFDGVDGFMTLKRLSDDLRISYVAVAVPSETPAIDNDVFRITVPMATTINGFYELEGRVRDLVGNHTIFGSVAFPFGDEDIVTLTLEIVDGNAVQYTQETSSVSARQILTVIGAERL